MPHSTAARFSALEIPPLVGSILVLFAPFDLVTQVPSIKSESSQMNPPLTFNILVPANQQRPSHRLVVSLHLVRQYTLM
jgi:hypothetical protein